MADRRRIDDEGDGGGGGGSGSGRTRWSRGREK